MLNKKRSIATVVVIIIVSIVSMLLSIAGIIGYNLFSINEWNNLRTLNTILADQAVSGLVYPVWYLDDLDIRETAEGIMQEKNVYAITVRQENSGKILLALARDSKWKSVEVNKVILPADLLVQNRKLILSSVKIGSVSVFMTTKFIQEKLQKILITIIICIVFVAITLILSIYFLLWRIVIRPLRTLEKYAFTVTGGQGEEQFIGQKFIGELNSLSTSISYMVLQLESRYAELKKINEQLRIEMEVRIQAENSLQISEEKLRELNSELENRVKQRTNELNQTIEVLKNTQTRMVQAEKMASLGVLTAGIAHEINNPVNYINASIIGLNNLITDILSVINKYDELNQNNYVEKLREVQDYKNQIDFNDLLEGVKILSNNVEIGINRVSEIIKGLKNFSRNDQEEKSESDINEDIDLTLSLLQNQIKGIINVKKEYEKIPTILCYKSKLNQVFMNILSNAIDSIKSNNARENTKEIVIKTSLLNSENGNFIKIEISDTGGGISEDIKEHIYEPFFTTKEVGKGTGLGLSITIGIIKKHDGNIEIKNTDKGACFTILIPCTIKLAKVL